MTHRDDVEKAVFDAINRERERSRLPPLTSDEEPSKLVPKGLREAAETLSVACPVGTLVILTRLRGRVKIAGDVIEALRAVPAGRNLWVPKGRLGMAAVEVTELTAPNGTRLRLGVARMGIDVVEEAAAKRRSGRFLSYTTIAILPYYFIARRQTFFTDRPRR